MKQHDGQPTRTVILASSTAKDATQVGLEKESVLGMIYENRPFELVIGQPITGEFAYELVSPMGMTTIPVIELAIENGNSGTRVMALHVATHQAVITQIPSVYEEEVPNLIYSAGEVGEFWQSENHDRTRSAIFRIGEDADNHKRLPLWPTCERWPDAPFGTFNHA